MSNPSNVTVQLTAAAATGAYNGTIAATGALTLAGSLVTGTVATMPQARRVAFTSTGSDTANIFTITGTNLSGAVITETVTGLTNAAPQTSAYDYVTVTRISASATSANTITIGSSVVGSSPWVLDNFLSRAWFLAGGIVGPTGTTYTLEFTFDDPNATAGSGLVGAEQFSMNAGSNLPPAVFPSTAAINGTAIVAASGVQTFAFANFPVFAHRVTVNSGTGAVTMQSIQAGMSSGW